MATTFSVKPLSPDLIDDYFFFFDNLAFADNPSWASCYCHFLFADHQTKAWNQHTAQDNRHAVTQLIQKKNMQGYLAYAAQTPVGWCLAGPKTGIPDLRSEKTGDENQIGTIGCFVVAKDYRRQGVARALLQAACRGFSQQGLTIAEAFPKTFEQAGTSEAEQHFGPLGLYLSEGFVIHQTWPNGRHSVQKRLATS